MRNIEKFGLLLSIFLVAMAGISNISAAQVFTSVDGVLSIDNLAILPTPVIAGENMTLSFQLFNSYINTLKNVNLQLTGENPIVTVSPASSSQLGVIGTGQYGGLSAAPFVYNFHVPSTMQAGVYTIDVVATYDTQEGTAGATEDVPGQSIMPISFYVYGIPNIQLTPIPRGQLVPGGQSIIDIAAINTGTDTARNVTLAVENSSYFTPSGPTRINLGIMQPGIPENATMVLQTAQNVPSGQINLPIRETYTAQSGQNVSLVENVPLSFVTGNPDIVASIQSAYPAQLYAGSNQTLSILIQNTGHGDAKNLSINFLSNDGLTVSGSASSFFVGTLPAGGSIMESVFVSANSNANKTSYTIPVAVSYTGLAANSSISEVLQVPIKLQGAAIFNITSESGSLLPGASYAPVTFTIRNNGNEPAQQASMSLQTTYPVSPANPNAYLASLAPGQSAQVTFYVSVDTNGGTGSYPVTLYEQWRQPNGYSTQQYSGSNNYFVQVGGNGGAQSYGNSAGAAQQSSSGGNSWLISGIGIVIVIVIAAVFFRQFRKSMVKRKQQSQEKHK